MSVKTHMRLRLTAIAAFLATMCIVVSGAAAAWGPNGECYRSAEETHHCYAISEWYMEGTEKVTGAVVPAKGEISSVSGWESGDFTTEELWVLFRGHKGWIETGQGGGYPYPSGQIHPSLQTRTSTAKNIGNIIIQPP